MNKIYDLRSDTVTRPTPEMRKAMYDAEVGDDVYGEDPTVNRLQEMAAERTGTEAALFVSSGCMGNLIPIYLNCGRGNELLIDSRGHVVNFEMSSAAAVAGSLPVSIPTRRGILDASLLGERVRPGKYDMARTRMVVVENTHNLAGGTVYPLETLRGIRDFAEERGLSVHMDGARLFNACIASGTTAREYAATCHTITFCLSKGLGAPVGALLCGSRSFVDEARRVRKMLGGGMRQAGVIAAAGIHALTHHVDRLAEDHENARTLVKALAEVPWAAIEPSEVETNIVLLKTRRVSSTLSSAAWAVSSVVGSRPISCKSLFEVFRSLLSTSIMCTGMRMVRA